MPLDLFLALFLLQDFTEVVPWEIKGQPSPEARGWEGGEGGKGERGAGGGLVETCLPKIENCDLGFLSREADLRLKFALGGICPQLGPIKTPSSLMFPRNNRSHGP